MGELNVLPVVKSTDLRDYTKMLFKDVEALEQMVSNGMMEEGVRRIGAEQELCLIDNHGVPSFSSDGVLSTLKDSHFTTELAKFNLEINLDPLELTGNCFTQLENDLLRLLTKCTKAGKKYGCHPLLTGILPTIGADDLGIDAMTPRQRYYALNEAILAMRKAPQKFYIQGTDELNTSSDSVMFESCNTSFQIHFQVDASQFAAYYNWAQAIAGPVLAACTNSPLFLGKRLWSETRIALFQQATETRSYQDELRRTKARVIFGDDWMTDEITDFIKKDLSTFRPLVLAEGITDSLEALDKGVVPKLKAFALFNGTIYRWNRPCYGITNGKPHFRIENRYIPAGPSVIDEVSNTAFWTGLMNGSLSTPVSQTMEFHHAKENFIKAARHGLAARLHWQGSECDAKELIIDELLPMAKKGLSKAQVNEHDIQYLDVLKERVSSNITGATWILNAFNSLSNANSNHVALRTIVEAIKSGQKQNRPVHQWLEINDDEVVEGAFSYQRVDQIMSKELYTVYEEDLIDLVPNIMKWNQVRHMLVENRAGDLVGLVTLGRLGKYYSEQTDANPVMVKEVMVKKVITVTPGTSTLDAIRLMQQHNIGCLPVLNKDKKLVGVITEKDFLEVAASYLKPDKTQSQP